VQSKFVFKIILTQGLNRQIRRMCEYLDYEVLKLKRSRIMSVELSNLKIGQWRELTKIELAEINAAVVNSTKTATEDIASKAQMKKPEAAEVTNPDSSKVPKRYINKKAVKKNKPSTLSLKPKSKS